jgi:hypothetical protein
MRVEAVLKAIASRCDGKKSFERVVPNRKAVEILLAGGGNIGLHQIASWGTKSLEVVYRDFDNLTMLEITKGRPEVQIIP